MLPRCASPERKIDATNVVVFMKRGTEAHHAVHPEVVGTGARRLRRFNLSTPHRHRMPGPFSHPDAEAGWAEARAPTNTNNMGMHCPSRTSLRPLERGLIRVLPWG